MSTAPHESLRERFAALLGGAWRQDPATGDDVLSGGAGAPVRLVSEDLAFTRRDRLWAHLQTLAARRHRLVVSVSMAPVPERAATLLARGVWTTMLAAAGLRVAVEVDDSPARFAGDAAWLDTWLRADPCRIGTSTRIGFLLEPDEPMSADPGAALARQLLGPQHEPIDAGVRVGFLITGYQDFHTLQPWFARMRPDQCRLFVRDAALSHQPGVIADLRAAAVPFDMMPAHLDDDPRAVLGGAGLDVLVSASESTANLAHLGNAATLLIARSLGIATAHAQHGIWPRAEFPPPVTSVADVVLAWANEYREVIAPPTRVSVVGAPRFDRYVDRVHRHVRGLYGAWTDRYARHVVLATNLHWTQHRAAVDPGALITRLATRFPDTLFTLKPHPYEAPPSADALPANVVVLAQPVMLAAGIEPADVVEAADLVVTTPSTFALEAALAGRPYLVLSTGNANRHDHVSERDTALLEAWLDDPAPDAAATAYASRYCAALTAGRAFDRTLAVLREVAGTAAPVSPASANVVDSLLAALTRLGHDLRALHERRDADLAEAARYATSLEGALARKDEYIASLRARADVRTP